MFIKIYFSVIVLNFSVIFFHCLSEKVTYISTEHPKVRYFNKNYLSFVNLTTSRYGRSNPIYYVGLHFDINIPIDDNFIVDFYFNEFLTNVYKRSFIEFHYTWCYLVEKDMFFGSAMRQGKLKQPCPHPPGAYHLVNMTINPAFIPKGFPFTKGRIECNVTRAKTNIRVADGFIDFNLLQIDKKKAKF